MSPSAVAVHVQHLTAEMWARRRHMSVADVLRMSTSEIDRGGRRLAEEQAARGVRTIDTATLGGALGGA